MNLKEKRLSLKKSQIDMASAIGVSLNTYILWERKVTNPNEENDIKLKEVIERFNEESKGKR